MGLIDVPRCQRVKVNGTQCGSPALRRRRHCYFHDRMTDGKKRFAAESCVKPRPLFSMGLLEDANAVQVALMQVLQLLGCGQMDPKTAGLMLYGLQTASCNLRHTTFEAEEATDVVIDRDTVAQTCINGPQWFEEDFDSEEEEEEEEDQDNDEVAASGESAETEVACADVVVEEPKRPEHAAQKEAEEWVRKFTKGLIPLVAAEAKVGAG